MLSALVLMAAFTQEPLTIPSPLTVKVVEAIDHNYLYADAASWVRLRSDLLADGDATVSSLGRKLASLQDGDLRIITREQMAVLQAETAGRERGIGLVDFAITVEPNTGDPKVVTPLVGSPAFKAGFTARRCH